MIAAYRNHFDIVKLLVESGADINRTNNKGSSALHDCAEAGSIEIFRYLLEHGAKVSKDNVELTPLINAAAVCHLHFVDFVVHQSTEPWCHVSPSELVDALLLLGATFVDKKRDLATAIMCWQRAFRLRTEMLAVA